MKIKVQEDKKFYPMKVLANLFLAVFFIFVFGWVVIRSIIQVFS